MGFRVRFSLKNQSSDSIVIRSFHVSAAWDAHPRIPKDFPSGFLLAMPALAADSGVVQFRAFNAGEELKAFLMPGEAEAGPGRMARPPKIKRPEYIMWLNM